MARSRSPSRRVQEVTDRFPDTKAAGVVLWDEHGGFLVGDQPKTGKWSEPGGKKMVGESAISCAKRELHEETGLDTETDVVIEWDNPTYIPDCKYLFSRGASDVGILQIRRHSLNINSCHSTASQPQVVFAYRE